MLRTVAQRRTVLKLERSTHPDEGSCWQRGRRPCLLVAFWAMLPSLRAGYKHGGLVELRAWHAPESVYAPYIGLHR